MKYPSISIVIPTFNEEKNIRYCLDSIFSQDYPKEKIEVIVADDNSTDETLKIAKEFPVKILNHTSKDPEAGKMIAFKKSTSEFFTYLDADIHLKGRDWFKKMMLPLIEDGSIAGSFTKYYSDEHSTTIEKFLNLDPLQRDPIYNLFSPSIESLIRDKFSNYYLCEYSKEKILPAGLCIHRKSLIKPLLNGERFLELDLLVDLVSSGNNRFAYVPSAGLYHHHAKNLLDLVKKRSRNVTKVYLKDNSKRKYRWFDLKKPEDFIKILLWTLWANLLIPEAMRGMFRALKLKSFIPLYQPLVSLLVTDVIIYSFLTDKRFLRLLRN